uniref:Serine protease n=1 Tax=Riboviria sp. TaxID=2585031 RepID=A0A8K1WRN3_9VIRU|nr:MAG: hypothetical protein 1 [Riboviria sp.]
MYRHSLDWRDVRIVSAYAMLYYTLMGLYIALRYMKVVITNTFFMDTVMELKSTVKSNETVVKLKDGILPLIPAVIPESVRPGSHMEPLKAMPQSQFVVAFDDVSGKVSSGMGFRMIADNGVCYDVTAQHVIAAYPVFSLIYHDKKVETCYRSEWKAIPGEDVAFRKSPDQGLARYHPQVLQTEMPVYCNSFEQISLGIVSLESYNQVIFSATTIPGFSGSPYYIRNKVYGMHLAGGTHNHGVPAHYLARILGVVKGEEIASDYNHPLYCDPEAKGKNKGKRGLSNDQYYKVDKSVAGISFDTFTDRIRLIGQMYYYYDPQDATIFIDVGDDRDAVEDFYYESQARTKSRQKLGKHKNAHEGDCNVDLSKVVLPSEDQKVDDVWNKVSTLAGTAPHPQAPKVRNYRASCSNPKEKVLCLNPKKHQGCSAMLDRPFRDWLCDGAVVDGHLYGEDAEEFFELVQPAQEVLPEAATQTPIVVEPEANVLVQTKPATKTTQTQTGKQGHSNAQVEARVKMVDANVQVSEEKTAAVLRKERTSQLSEPILPTPARAPIVQPPTMPEVEELRPVLECSTHPKNLETSATASEMFRLWQTQEANAVLLRTLNATVQDLLRQKRTDMQPVISCPESTAAPKKPVSTSTTKKRERVRHSYAQRVKNWEMNRPKRSESSGSSSSGSTQV